MRFCAAETGCRNRVLWAFAGLLLLFWTVSSPMALAGTSASAPTSQPAPAGQTSTDPGTGITYTGLHIEKKPAVLVESIGWSAAEFDWDPSVHGKPDSDERKAFMTTLHYMKKLTIRCWDLSGRGMPNRPRLAPYSYGNAAVAPNQSEKGLLTVCFYSPFDAAIASMRMTSNGKPFLQGVRDSSFSSASSRGGAICSVDYRIPVETKLPASVDATVLYTAGRWMGPGRYSPGGTFQKGRKPPGVGHLKLSALAETDSPPAPRSYNVFRPKSQLLVKFAPGAETNWIYRITVMTDKGEEEPHIVVEEQKAKAYRFRPRVDDIKAVLIRWRKLRRMEIKGISLKPVQELKRRKVRLELPPERTRKILGPSRTVTVPVFAPGSICMLDLETGKLHKALGGREGEHNGRKRYDSWTAQGPLFRKVGIDLTLTDYKRRTTWPIWRYGLIVEPMSGKWKDVTPDKVSRTLRRLTTAAPESKPGSLAAFRTADGSMGVMELRELRNGKSMTIRYRLLVDPPEKQVK